MRVVADHARSTTFLIADGVIPSNEWRGYVLRKIMRRAMRHGKHLGLSAPFLHQMVAVLDREMGDAYPELRANRDMVERTIIAEENRFDAVLTDGLPRLEAAIGEALNTPERVLPGDVAFRLYDTFGMPYDFIEDTAATKDLRVDRVGFDVAMTGQREQARKQSAFGGASKDQKFTVGLDGLDIGDRFDGYESTEVSGVPVMAIWNDARQPVEELNAGDAGYLALARTPFYLEAGGQVSDAGTVVTASGAVARVSGLTRTAAGMPRAHHVHVESGVFHRRDVVTATVDAALRDATRRNHTATHLLHAALRQVLGTHVKQAGSLVAPDRLRFDFVHFEPITRDDLDRIERIVNQQIVKNTAVDTEVRSTEEAIAAGAMALFGEKYGDKVRVVSVPGFSVELCGGTHVRATGDIGLFVALSESGVAAGVRRIEALTGLGAVASIQHQRAALHRLIVALNVNEDQAVEVVQKLQGDAKKLAREVSQLKSKLAMSGGVGDGDRFDIVEAGGLKLARAKSAGLDKDALRGLADSMKSAIKSGVVLVTSTNDDGKVSIVVAVTGDLTTRIAAGRLVKELAPIVGGGGGGRPDFAEAGGKDPSKIDLLHERAPEILASLLRAQ
jgi:alanyl-tRNA synthetase